MELGTEKLDNDITRITLDGRMDVQGTQQIEMRLAGHMAVDHGRIIIDLTRVSFLASIGIRAILLSAKALQRRGGKLALFGASEDVGKVLTLAGIDTLIPVCADLDAARGVVSS